MKELRRQRPSTQILKHRLIIRMSNTFFFTIPTPQLFFRNNTLQNIFRNPCFLEVQSMCHVSLLDYPALPPLEDFNFNCFYFFFQILLLLLFFFIYFYQLEANYFTVLFYRVKCTKKHKYDFDSQTKQIKGQYC